jgi:hypothetical protein
MNAINGAGPASREVERPALAEGLAAITDRPVGHWRAEIASPAFVRVERISSRDVRWTVRVDPFRATTQTRRATLRSTEPAYEARRFGRIITRVERVQVAPAHTITPAEAVEGLAGLWPWEPGDIAAPLWRCEACDGARLVRTYNFEYDWCKTCDRDDDNEPTGHTADPPSLAALVAVVSLGAPKLARHVELARVIARVAGYSGARVVWGVMTRKAIEAHHKRVSDTAEKWDFPSMVSREEFLRSIGNASWPGLCPYDVRHEVSWAAIREISVGGGATPQPTGVHLVALDASRIVLAVEAL